MTGSQETASLLITCPYGLANCLKQELQDLGIQCDKHFSTGVFATSDEDGVMRINYESHLANKVWECVHRGPCVNFDQLFDSFAQVNWESCIPKGANIEVLVTTHQSKLTSVRTIQSISNKAVYKQIAPNTRWEVDPKVMPFEILVHIEDDKGSLWINRSGEGLHKRGWRLDTGDAPIKENIAYGLLMLAKRTPEHDLWDPCCGSGTILIEAALLAKKLGLKPHLIGTDKDSVVLKYARANAERAGVADYIERDTRDLCYIKAPMADRIITNPPYGKRLISPDIQALYSRLGGLFAEGMKGGVITGWEQASNVFSPKMRRIVLKNGADDTTFFVQ